MASDDKKTKTEPTPKKEPEATSKTTGKDAAKAASGDTGAAPSNYSRGEGQKPVSRAYKENWNAIFGKKAVKTKTKKR